jgi:RNA polymerase II subunit A-like phosphatase
VGEEREEETLFGSWDAGLEGIVEEWFVNVGDVIPPPPPPTNKTGSKKAHHAHTKAITLTTPCTHDVQFLGLCASCGLDLTSLSYTDIGPSTSLASLPTTHLKLGPLVSEREAKRESEELKRWLRGERKLVLVVDLDQTVLQATVDPSVGVWRKEGREWEKRRKLMGGGGEEEPPNPNWKFLKDVRSFRLPADGPGVNPNSVVARKGRRNGKRQMMKAKDAFIISNRGSSPSLTPTH